MKFRIVYIGDNKYLAWDSDNDKFVPVELHLYVTTFDSIEAVFKELRRVRHLCSGWWNNIFIEPIE